MPAIEIYTKAGCPFCRRAKALLSAKAVAFTEIAVDGDPAAQQAMARRAGGRWTVPQIFIDGVGIGGCDDLYDLDNQGRLDPLLGRA